MKQTSIEPAAGAADMLQGPVRLLRSLLHSAISDQPSELRNEQGLARQLSSSLQTTMALGGAIGTGLFLASGLSVNIAGPAVVLSYVIVAVISLFLGRALTEMAVAHPTAGAFGVYAGMYLSPFAGYAVRVSYWLMQVVATGAQLVAASIYMGYWFPGVPGAVWVLVFSALLLYINTWAVGRLGTLEYWLVMMKVLALMIFAGLALLVLSGLSGQPAIGLRNLTEHGGFMPFGMSGVWLGCCFAIYSFIGVEIIGVTSGEASDPAQTIPRAMRRMVFGLSAIYIVTIILLAALTPWNQMGVGESPFVRVLSGLGIPGAAGVMNLVVLSAALSSSNANLYLIARTLFSLARAGFVSPTLGVVTPRGAPVNALLVSGLGLGVAVLVRAWWPDSAYVWFFGVALFGALFVWLMIFVTHIAYCKPALPVGSCVGAALVALILLSTWWAPGLQSTLLAGGPWLALLAIGYRRSKARVVPQDLLADALSSSMATKQDHGVVATNQEYIGYDQVAKPQSYHLAESADETFDDEYELTTCDIGRFLNGNADDRRKFAQELGEALHGIGFAILEGHGIDASRYDEAEKRVAAMFTSLTLAEKMRFRAERFGSVNQGYFPMKETSDIHPDLVEGWVFCRRAFDLGEEPVNLPAFWPQPAHEPFFRALCQSHEQLILPVMQSLLSYLGCDPHLYDAKLTRTNFGLRLNYYPKMSRNDEASGAGRLLGHEDVDMFTFLPAPRVEGLQLLNRTNMKWVRVNAPAGTIILNIGDYMQRISNDVFPSTTHRVSKPRDPSMLGAARVSFPMAVYLWEDEILEVLPGLANPRYPPIRAIEFHTRTTSKFYGDAYAVTK